MSINNKKLHHLQAVCTFKNSRLPHTAMDCNCQMIQINTYLNDLKLIISVSRDRERAETSADQFISSCLRRPQPEICRQLLPSISYPAGPVVTRDDASSTNTNWELGSTGQSLFSVCPSHGWTVKFTTRYSGGDTWRHDIKTAVCVCAYRVTSQGLLTAIIYVTFRLKIHFLCRFKKCRQFAQCAKRKYLLQALCEHNLKHQSYFKQLCVSTTRSHFTATCAKTAMTTQHQDLNTTTLCVSSKIYQHIDIIKVNLGIETNTHVRT